MHGHRFSGWIVPLLAALVVSFSAPSSAARWEPLPLWGGEVQVAAARGGSSVVYAATPASGFYRSADGGTTWQLMSRGPNRFRLQILGVDPHDPHRLYVFASDSYNKYRGFFRSEDGGKHWRRSDAGIPESVGGVAFDPATPGRIYAATSTGLYRSGDQGTNWSRIAFPGKLVVRVAVAPGDPRIVLASVRAEDYDGTTERSIDGGATFVEVLDRAVQEYVFDPGHPGRLYGIDLMYGLRRSDDLGATWTDLPPEPVALRALTVTPAGTLLAGSFERGVARSVDGGLTWESLPGRHAVPADAISSLAVREDGSVLAGGFRGVWRSPSDGRGWRASSTGILGQWILALEAGADSTLWTSAGGGFFISGDEGESFRPRPIGSGRTGFLERLAIHPRQSQVAYAFGCCAGEFETHGLLKTEDAGRTWELLPYTGVQGDEVGVVAVDPVDPDFVYAGGSLQPHGSLCTALRSTDGGATWHCMIPLATSEFTDLVIDPRDPRILHGLFDGFLYRSADRGQTWKKVSTRAQAINHLTLDPARPGRFFALSQIGLGVYRSENGGRSWTLSAAGLPENSLAHDLLLDPSRPGRLWLAVEVFEIGPLGKSTGRVFRSDDAGSHWKDVTAGLAPGTVVLHLAASPEGADVLYAGTAGQGLYRLAVEE